MAALKMRLTSVSPQAVYLDDSVIDSPLAPRSASLDGKVIGLLPNWRPGATEMLKAVGSLLEQRFRLKGVVLEPKVGIVYQHHPDPKMLDDLARRVDAVIVAGGD